MTDCCMPGPQSSNRTSVATRNLPAFVMRSGAACPAWSVVTSPSVRDALLTLFEQVLRQWSDLSQEEDALRVALLQLYAEHGRAPALSDLAARTLLSELALQPLLASLRRRDLVVLTADGKRIVGAYPFSDGVTGHRIKLDGRFINAMCAVDALGVGAMFERDVEVHSGCQCGVPITITTREQGKALARVQPETAVAWLGLQVEHGCAANSLCTVTNFFCTEAHLAAWRNKHPDARGARLSPSEALEAGRAIFAPSLVDANRGGPQLGAPTMARASRARAPAVRSKDQYDLIVVGAGSAGFSAAITASEQGARTALVGSGVIGGTCTNIGCVPSKALIRATEALHNARVASRFAGVRAQGEITDWSATIRQKDALVAERRRAKYTDLLPVYDGIDYLEGEARLVIDGAVIKGGPTIQAPRTIIATGARPAVPAIPGIEAISYLTSTSALDLQELPKSLLVIGAGYIGAELAQLFARAGVNVTLVCRSRLLPQAEPEISAALAGYFADEGITVVSGIKYRAIQRNAGGVTLAVTRDRETINLNADIALIATGRAPNTEHLGLAELKVTTSQTGSIVIDDRMRTTRPGIYAAGDVTDTDQFVYMAAYGAKLAALNALNGDSSRYDNTAMPAVVFTDPQVASVGLTEAAARAAGFDVRVSTIGLDHVPRALAARDTRGLVKLVADDTSRRLLGAHLIAPEGADSIQTAALAIGQGLTIDDLADMLFPYLTTVEGLKLAAQAFDKDIAKLSCCAG